MVKCSECGFLALRDKANGLLVEVNDDYRVSGRIPEYITGYKEYHNYPICFVMAYDLMPEVEQAVLKQTIDQSDDWGKYVLEVITRERDCPTKHDKLGFTEYQQGFTPREHREMLDRKWLLDFQAKREQEDKQWREEQRRSDLQWREEQDKKAEKRHRWDLIILGIVVTIIVSFATVASALIQRGSWLP